MARRLLDVVGAIAGLIVLGVPMLVISVMVRLRMSSPVFHRTVRAGLEGRPFTMLKFRTMIDLRDAQGQLLPDADRLTHLGRLLRATSLDELPELINVLKGDMSLVGPRPLPVRYLERYTPEQARRHEVKPGITGWSQIRGRNALDWEERLAEDVWYVDHQSLLLDLRILWLTLFKVIRREGVSAPGHATMPEFWGAPDESPDH